MATATLVTRIPNRPQKQNTDLVKRIGAWLARLGESATEARAARKFATLNRLSDEELALRGLTRTDLMDHCFSALRHG